MKNNSKVKFSWEVGAIQQLLELIEGAHRSINGSILMNSTSMVKGYQHLKKDFTKQLIEMFSDLQMPVELYTGEPNPVPVGQLATVSSVSLQNLLDQIESINKKLKRTQSANGNLPIRQLQQQRRELTAQMLDLLAEYKLPIQLSQPEPKPIEVAA